MVAGYRMGAMRDTRSLGGISAAAEHPSALRLRAKGT